MNKNWRKVVYLDQGVEDTYVSTDFLVDLSLKGSGCVGVSSIYQFTMCIAQQCCFVLSYLLAWYILRVQQMNNRSLVFVTIVTAALSAAKPASGDSKGSIWEVLRGAIAVFGSLWVATPVLKTLTYQYNDVSVLACSTGSFLLHVLFRSYQAYYSIWDISQTAKTSSLSLSAAIFSSVLLASRLRENLQVFFFLFFGIHFICFNPLAVPLKEMEEWKGLIKFGISCLMAFAITWFACGRLIAFGFFLWVSLFIAGIPNLMQSLKHHKVRISGPWDVANPFKA